MSIHVNIRQYEDGLIESATAGCGCCSHGITVTVDEAIEEIENAIEELNKELNFFKKIKEKSE